jgi:acyl-CoA thioester hydrolase
VALFLAQAETPAAAGHFVHVFVDRQTRRTVTLSTRDKAALADLAAQASQTR